MPEKVLVANRGEIAVRIMRTLRQLGIASVAVYHAEDARSRAVQEADEAVELFGDTPVGAYLDVAGIVAACASTGATAVHPGFGFLSENASFAEVIAQQLTTARVGAFFAQYLTGGVRRWSLPGLDAINFVLEGALGGRGGTSTLRYDPQGKSFGAMLLEVPITVPAAWDANGLLIREGGVAA